MTSLLSPLLLSVPFVLLTACGDPILPEASGVITLDPSASTAGFSTLEVSFDPLDAEGKPIATPVAVSVPLSPTLFPYSYQVGGGVGTNDNPTWMVRAWFSKTPVGEALEADPSPGEPSAAATLNFPGCSSGCSADGTNLKLAVPAP